MKTGDKIKKIFKETFLFCCFSLLDKLSIRSSKISNSPSPRKLKTFKGEAFGFTLAEVLIVLGIIGIVANMTIPTLIKNIEQQVLLTQFKEVYSSLQQAYLQVAQENGTGDQWTDVAVVYANFKPYFKVIKECPDGSCVVTHSTYKTLSGVTDAAINPRYHLILANGTTIYFYPSASGDPAGLKIDTNGYKLPNRLGYDLFEMEFSKKNNAPFISWPGYTGNGSSFIEDSSYSCNKSSPATSFWMGGGCSYWVIKNGNMDYLNRDIPDAEWIR